MIREEESNSDTLHRAWVIGTLTALIYASFNAFSISVRFSPGSAVGIFTYFSPGMNTFILWTLLLPAVFMIGNWFWLSSRNRTVHNWWIQGAVFSGVYVAYALLTFLIITAMWASF